jgi:hypothetical protein
MGWSDWITTISLIVTVLSLIVTLLQWQHAKRLERADRHNRQQMLHFLRGLKGAEVTPRMEKQINDEMDWLKSLSTTPPLDQAAAPKTS